MIDAVSPITDPTALVPGDRIRHRTRMVDAVLVERTMFGWSIRAGDSRLSVADTVMATRWALLTPIPLVMAAAFTDPQAAAAVRAHQAHEAGFDPPLSDRARPTACLARMVAALGVDVGTLTAQAQRTLVWLAATDSTDGLVGLFTAARQAQPDDSQADDAPSPGTCPFRYVGDRYCSLGRGHDGDHQPPPGYGITRPGDR